MHFEIAHHFDAPLDTVELAVLSPDLGEMLLRSLTEARGSGPGIASVETLEHELEDGELRRVLKFQATAALPLFGGRSAPPDALSWSERSTYRLADHMATWEAQPKQAFRRYVTAVGTYRLERIANGRTRRTIAGDLVVHLPMVGGLVERMALAEIRRTYDAEAETLRRLATL